MKSDSINNIRAQLKEKQEELESIREFLHFLQVALREERFPYKNIEISFEEKHPKITIVTEGPLKAIALRDLIKKNFDTELDIYGNLYFYDGIRIIVIII